MLTLLYSDFSTVPLQARIQSLEATVYTSISPLVGQHAEDTQWGKEKKRNGGLDLLTCTLLLLFSLAMDAVGLVCMEIYALQGHSYH